MSELDLNRLPSERTVTKGYFNGTFGTTYTLSRADMDPYPGGDALERGWPEIVTLIMDKFRSMSVPNWKPDIKWLSDDFNAATYVAAYFTLHYPMPKLGPLKMRSILSEVAYLLSGHFQLGEELNLTNFNRYARCEGMKFLPFLITDQGFQFHVFNPTPDRIQTALRRLPDIENFCITLKPVLMQILNRLNALIRLEQVSSSSRLIEPACEDLRDQLRVLIDNRVNSLGFLYQDLRGPQDATAFHFAAFNKSLTA